MGKRDFDNLRRVLIARAQARARGERFDGRRYNQRNRAAAAARRTATPRPSAPARIIPQARSGQTGGRYPCGKRRVSRQAYHPNGPQNKRKGPLPSRQ